MSIKLQDNPRFVAEYADYKKRILAITDQRLQDELTKLLVQLKEQVRFIDRTHEQVYMTGRIPGEVSDLRNDLIKHRKTLDQKLRDWESRNLR
jgi:hypothetical protein